MSHGAKAGIEGFSVIFAAIWSLNVFINLSIKCTKIRGNAVHCHLFPHAAFLKSWEVGSSAELEFKTHILYGLIRKNDLSVIFTEEWVSFQAE